MSTSESIVIGADWISEHYLTSGDKGTFSAEVRKRDNAWRGEDKEGRPTPKSRFTSQRQALVNTLMRSTEGNGQSKTEYRRYLDLVLETLGYTEGRGLSLERQDSILWVARAGNAPSLAIVEAKPAETIEDAISRDVENNSLLVPTIPDPETGEEFTNAARLISHLYLDEPNPPFILLLAGKWAILTEKERWPEGRFLAINLQLVAERNDARVAGEIATAMACLEAESLLPDFEGTAWWTRQLEESVKHTVGVSKDLREGVRESIELIATEVVERRQAKGLPPLPQEQAQPLARQALRFLYRILFLLYAEASPELEVLPVGAPEYEQGYSLDRLRELVQVPLPGYEDQQGTHLYESLRTLFRLVDRGFHSDDPQGIQFNALRADLFSPSATALIDEVGLGNGALQEVLARLLLSKERRGKDRGFISYAELGINQLGAVYEGLMSYEGFFAEDHLFEVAPKGNTEKGSWVVPESRVEGISVGDLVRYEDPETGEKKPVIYAPGSFVFRLSGRERQRSASYYTPEVLTRFTVGQGLEELITPEMTAEEILGLTVCEPALGSGAFAIEATRQLAEQYLKRRQDELGETIDPTEYPVELQKAKAYIALHNVYGVDLNETAVELAEISLWLDTMVAGLDAPWFGLHLRAGNSLIGARHSYYRPHDLRKRAWLKQPPTPLPLTSLADNLQRARISPEILGGAIHHFLLPADGWGETGKGKIAKELEPERSKRLREWASQIKRQPTKAQEKQLQGLAVRVERLWQLALQRLRIAEEQSARTIDVWGKETEHKEKSVQREEIEAALHDPDGAYQRLRTVMNAWAALWFWPVTENMLRVQTDDGELIAQPPSLDRWIETLSQLLGTPEKKIDYEGATLFTTTDWHELDELEEVELKLSGAQPAAQVRKNLPWLQVTDRVSHDQRFFHWELDFASVFAKGGFDLQVGNPPWVRPRVVENDLLAEGDPWWHLTTGAKQAEIKERRRQTLALPGIQDLVVNESSAVLDQSAFMAAPATYPHLTGLQPDTYRCFMELTWRNMSEDGAISLIHPDSHFTDTKAGPLRAATYGHLRRHWQFINEKMLFEEVHHHKDYGVHVYGRADGKPHFLQAVSLFTPETVEGSLRHSGEGEEPGFKDREGNWDTASHRDRITRVDEETLATWNSIYGDDSLPADQTPMAYTVNRSLENVLEQVGRSTRIGSLEPKFSRGWDESIDRKKGIFDHGWGVPESWDDVILKGPHLHIGNPSYKHPNESMKHNQDTYEVDLEQLTSDAIPVTPYKPTANPEVYDAQYTDWGSCGKSDPARDHYRLAFRAMAANTGERTLIGAIIPPGAAHIHRILSTGFSTPRDLLTASAFSHSLLTDLVVRSSPKSDVLPGVVERLPIVADHPLLPQLHLRVLRLNCLTDAYADLWADAWDDAYLTDAWAGGRKRANREPLAPEGEVWTARSPLRIAEDRRQALVEIDALVAAMLGISADQLAAVYRTAFPVLYGYDTKRNYYDENGRLVPGDIVKKWLKDGDELNVEDRTATNESGYTYTYEPPFVLLDREADLREAHAYFSGLNH